MIDSTVVPFEQGQTILEAASRANIAIPTLCCFEGIEPPTSCYVCVVKIKGKNTLTPSCATLAAEGMILESNSEEVRRYRRRALELLLSEHAGDCEAPCRRICPADLDIPEMTRHIASCNLEAAARTVWERLPLPGVLGYVCAAPCEKGCYRVPADGAVSIRELHKSVAEAAFVSAAGMAPRTLPASGKKVAILGAGPAGLSSAHTLSLLGHACTIIDERDEPGGMLRYGTDRARLPLPVLDREIAVIRSLGVAFRMGCRISDQHALDELIQSYDAVLLATGMPPPDQPWAFTVKASAKGITVEANTFASSCSGVFAFGGAIAVCRMAARAVGQGRLAAQSVHQFLTNGASSAARPHRFDSHLGKPDAEETRQLVSTDLAVIRSEGSKIGPLAASAVVAAARCMQCDCGKKLSCALRAYAHEYEINRDQYRTGARKRVTRKRYASGLMHEPGKCIDCGRCVGITTKDHILPGLTFGNRGFDVIVKTPFGADMDEAMGNSLDRCIAACPVGALWNWKQQDHDQ
jgi:ferredoxin